MIWFRVIDFSPQAMNGNEMLVGFVYKFRRYLLSLPWTENIETLSIADHDDVPFWNFV